MYFTLRIRQTDMPCHWSTKHQRRHSLPQVLPGARPHEQCPRFHPSWGTEALSHPGRLANGRRSKKKLVEWSTPSRKLRFGSCHLRFLKTNMRPRVLPQSWEVLSRRSSGSILHGEADGRNPVLTWWHALLGFFCLGLLKFLFTWRNVDDDSLLG